MIRELVHTLALFMSVSLCFVFGLDLGLYHLTPQPQRIEIVAQQDSSEVILKQGAFAPSLLSHFDSEQVLRIQRTPGGSQETVRLLRERNVVIDGQCVSACVWLLVTSDNVCFTEQSTFFFHAWHIVYTYDMFRSRQLQTLTKRSFRNNPLTQLYLNQVREPIRTEVTGLLETSGVINVSTELFVETYPDKICT